MKNTILIFAMICLLGIFESKAQQRAEKIKAMKVAFITQRLNLTPEEAQVFWPIYNKYQEDKRTIQKSFRPNLQSAKNDFLDLSDKEAQALINKNIERKQALIDLEARFLKNVQNAISAKKTLMLLKAEQDFQKELVKTLQNRQQNNRQRQGRGW